MKVLSINGHRKFEKIKSVSWIRSSILDDNLFNKPDLGVNLRYIVVYLLNLLLPHFKQFLWLHHADWVLRGFLLEPLDFTVYITDNYGFSPDVLLDLGNVSSHFHQEWRGLLDLNSRSKRPSCRWRIFLWSQKSLTTLLEPLNGELRILAFKWWSFS